MIFKTSLYRDPRAREIIIRVYTKSAVLKVRAFGIFGLEYIQMLENPKSFINFFNIYTF